MNMVRRWIKLVLRILGLFVLAGIGVLLGMGVREWVVPHLPASVGASR